MLSAKWNWLLLKWISTSISKIDVYDSSEFLLYRLLWREYLSQVVHAQNSSNQNLALGTENDPSAQQERIRYRYLFH